MKPTILIDMDDTLLSNPFDVFMPAYFKLLGAALANWVEPKTMLAQLMKSTNDMLENNDFQVTLENKFARNFYTTLNLDKLVIDPVLSNFYASDFENLSTITAPRPEAIQLVNASQKKGYTVAVATNPLFPKSAMLSRLRWGKLPIDIYNFPIVTSYESFHFAKPNPAYYAEILAQLGWPEGPVFMIGNSLSDDIVPAASLGIKTYYLTDKPEQKDHLVQGPLSECLPWIEEEVKNDHFSLNYADLPALIAYLRATPAAIQTLLSGCSVSQLNFQPKAKEWSIKEVICHLRDVDGDVNLPRFKSILQEGKSFIPAIDTDAWATERVYQDQPYAQALQSYFDNRKSLIDLVLDMEKEDLQRLVNHSVFGPTTIAELLKFVVIHDQNHVRQIKANLDAAKFAERSE